MNTESNWLQDSSRLITNASPPSIQHPENQVCGGWGRGAGGRATESQGEWEPLVKGWWGPAPRVADSWEIVGRRHLFSVRIPSNGAGAAQGPAGSMRGGQAGRGRRGWKQQRLRDSALPPAGSLPACASPAVPRWPGHQRAAATHTGLAFLAFFSALTASSWAFRFSASLLACEDKGGDPSVMGGASRGDAGPPGMSLQNRQAFQPGNHIPTVTPTETWEGGRDRPGFSKNAHKRKNLIPAAGHSWRPA